MKDRFENERALDGNVRVYLWPATFVAGRRVSLRGDRTLVEPERQLPAMDQRPIIRRPVPDLVSEREFAIPHLRMLSAIRCRHFCNNASSNGEYQVTECLRRARHRGSRMGGGHL